MALSTGSRSRIDIFCRLSTMHERDRQTDKNRQTDHAMTYSIWMDRQKQSLRRHYADIFPKQEAKLSLG